MGKGLGLLDRDTSRLGFTNFLGNGHEGSEGSQELVFEPQFGDFFFLGAATGKPGEVRELPDLGACPESGERWL